MLTAHIGTGISFQLPPETLISLALLLRSYDTADSDSTHILAAPWSSGGGEEGSPIISALGSTSKNCQ